MERFGDVPRNSLYGPGLNIVNLSGSKTFSLPWEGIQIQIRADASKRIQPSQLRCAGRCQPRWLSWPRNALHERLTVLNNTDR